MLIPRRSRCLGTLAASLLLLAACNERPGTESDPAQSVESRTKAGGAKEPCSALGKRVCGEVGEDSPTCESVRTTLELLSDSACSAGLQDFEATKAKLKKQGKKCDELVAKLCAGVGEDTDSCRMVKEKSKAFPPAQCAAMMAQVDDIVRELQQQEKANQPLSAELQAKVEASDAPSFGPSNAKVTLVEFSDFECPYCSRAASVAGQVKQQYGDRVRFVFRQFPLDFHQNAQVAAEASLAANAQGKFWEFHDKLFENQQSLGRSSLESYAKELGLDVAKFKAAMDAPETARRVKADLELGKEVAVQGTPTLFINGKRIGNPTDFGEVSKAIEAALGS